MGKLAARYGEGHLRYLPLVDLEQALHFIDTGIIPPDAEIYLPHLDEWLSVSEFERTTRGPCYRSGDSTHSLKTFGQARRLINEGTIPPDAEIYYPDDHTWMTVSEYLEFTYDLLRAMTPGEKIKAVDRRETKTKVKDAAVKTVGCVFGYAVWVVTMVVAVYVLRDIGDGSRLAPIIQLALLIGGLILPLWGAQYWWSKVDR